ncbi:MAG: hypothetical protein QMD85_03685 [Candidatus Aenigmarchaeota archaeon]|nr:hypothetical protein [Candidatus Aenigmarchaeota archaeon]MDI6722657.1 hypothetical protein [Candidatus Aenigmarchaeota archaeon]
MEFILKPSAANNNLDKSIEKDLQDHGIDNFVMLSLPCSEESARIYKKMMEDMYKGLPPMTDGRLLSTGIDW